MSLLKDLYPGERGRQLIALCPPRHGCGGSAGKLPHRSGWQHEPEQVHDLEGHIEKLQGFLDGGHANVGMVIPKGELALDIDTTLDGEPCTAENRDRWAAPRAVDLFDGYPLQISGKRITLPDGRRVACGIHVLVSDLGWTRGVTHYHGIPFTVRTPGQQIVVEPSLRAGGERYAWLGGETPPPVLGDARPVPHPERWEVTTPSGVRIQRGASSTDESWRVEVAQQWRERLHDPQVIFDGGERHEATRQFIWELVKASPLRTQRVEGDLVEWALWFMAHRTTLAHEEILDRQHGLLASVQGAFDRIGHFIEQRAEEDAEAFVEAEERAGKAEDAPQEPSGGPEATFSGEMDEDEEEPQKARWSIPWDVLMEMDLRVEWVIQNLLLAGGTSLISADPKVGKSVFAMEMARCIATGDPFLGRFGVPETRRVLYADLDGSLELHRERVMELRADHTDQVSVLSESHYLPRLQSEGVALRTPFDLIERVMEEDGPFDVVILDTLNKALRVEDLNDYATADAAMTLVRSMASKTGSHICLVHHARKSGGEHGQASSGSAAIVGNADTTFTLRRHGEERTMETTQRHGRDILTHELLMEDGRLVFGEPWAEAQEERKQEARQEKKRSVESRIEQDIIAVVSSHTEGITYRNITAKVRGDDKTIREMLLSMVEDGTLEKSRVGQRVLYFHHTPRGE